MAENLFREQVVQSQSGRHSGEIILAQPLSYRLLTQFVAAFMLALLLFLVFAGYTRKERAFGVIVARAGEVRLIAPEAGIVRHRPVREGQSVKQGDLVFELEQPRQSDLGNTQQLMERSLNAQKARLSQEIGQRGSLAKESVAALQSRLDRLARELRHLDSEIALQEEQVAASKRLADNLKPLFDERIVSEVQYQQQVGAYIEQKARLEGLRRNRLTLQGDVEQARSQQRQEALRAQSERAALERSLFANEQEFIQQRGARLLQIQATRAGTITALLANEGQAIPAGAPVATIIPSGDVLDAHLFVASNAVGFIAPGQRVRLRYDAYPYQKFGQYEGTVAEVVSADIPGRDLTNRFPQLGDKGPAFFRITVRLAQPKVHAYGREFPLRPGMTLLADIQLERKRIIEWIFDPLLAMGRTL
jgi:membrane fusion protein